MKYLAYAAIAAVLSAAAPAQAERGSDRHHRSDKSHHAEPHDRGHARPCGRGPARKGCAPYGQAKKYRVGHKFNHRFGGYTPYYKIPRHLRTRYRLSPRGRYVYDGYYIYRVDPSSLAVSQVLTAALR